MDNNKDTVIDIKFDSKEDYYKLMNNLISFTNENIKVYEVSKTKNYEVILEEETES